MKKLVSVLLCMFLICGLIVPTASSSDAAQPISLRVFCYTDADRNMILRLDLDERVVDFSESFSVHLSLCREGEEQYGSDVRAENVWAAQADDGEQNYWRVYIAEYVMLSGNTVTVNGLLTPDGEQSATAMLWTDIENPIYTSLSYDLVPERLQTDTVASICKDIDDAAKFSTPKVVICRQGDRLYMQRQIDYGF